MVMNDSFEEGSELALDTFSLTIFAKFKVVKKNNIFCCHFLKSIPLNFSGYSFGGLLETVVACESVIYVLSLDCWNNISKEPVKEINQ